MTDPLLQRLERLGKERLVLDSRDADEVRRFLGKLQHRLVVGRDGEAPFAMTIRGVRLPHMTISEVRSDAPVGITMSLAASIYGLVIPLHGRLECRVAGETVRCGGRHAAIGSPRRPLEIRSERGCRRVWVAIEQPALMRAAEALLGEPVGEPVRFAPTLDLASEAGRTLLTYLGLAVRERTESGPALRHPALAEPLEQLILRALLLTQPSSISDRLQQPPPRIAPRDVRRALDHIEANLEAPVTLADLVAASGVPGRTLAQHFRDFTGLSPMAYLRAARFRRVREALLHDGSEACVTELAARWGFAHFGRFSVEYRRRFGESPSTTARRRPPRD
jgi:AraC-like DNA-binding protein